MSKLQLPIDKAHRLISPRIAYIVTTVDKLNRINAAVFSNVTSVSTDPERLVLAVYKEWDTIKNVRETREFVVSVPSKKLIEEVWICGDKYAGNPIPRGVNELEVANLKTVPSLKVKPPRILDCYGHIECKVKWAKDVGNHYLILGEIVAATFTEKYFSDEFILDLSKAQPLMEITRNRFTYPERVISVDRQKVKSKVKGILKRMGVRISKKLAYYESTVFSEE